MKITITLLLAFIAFAHGQAQEMVLAASAQQALSRAAEFQQNLNKEYLDPEKSPLSPEDLLVFDKLSFYPISPLFQIEAKFVRTPQEKTFRMTTTTARLPEYVKYGEAHFTLSGREIVLFIYQNIELVKKEAYRDHLFLPFRDLSSGNGSYAGGRYLDLKIPKGQTITLDFNQAYNPYCVYNAKYSCPIPPLQNFIPVAIYAGVKDFSH